MIAPKTFANSFFRVVYLYARQRRNSEWIYSNKAEQMSHARKGKIFVCSYPGNDAYNCTLRMHKTLQTSSLVLSQRPLDTTKLLQSIAQKIRFNESTVSIQSQALQIIKNSSGDLVSFDASQTKQRDFQSVMQHSKHLEMAVEIEKINKSNNDRDNRILKKHQEQLNKFLESSSIKEKLQAYKKQNGFPRIVNLVQNIPKMDELRNGGINIFCFLDENQPIPSKTLFRYLQQKQIPYEVLPAVNHIVSLLASSGFPADRFAIEYFPTSIPSALEKRKLMKMTVGMVLEKQRLLSAIEAIKKIYGVENIIYLQSQQGKMIYRGRVNDFQNGLLMQDDGLIVRIAIAPYISTFNEELKEERNKVGRLYGEAMSDNTHAVRMEFINKELKELLKRKDSRKISVNALMQQLSARAGNGKAALIAAEILGLRLQQTEKLLSRAQKETITDHLGISEHIRKK